MTQQLTILKVALTVCVLAILTACATKEPAKAPVSDKASPPKKSIEKIRYPLALPADSLIEANVTEYPWSAFGRVNVGGREFCNGMLISARHVLTEARCLYNRDDQRWWGKSWIHFVAAYQREDVRINSGIIKFAVSENYKPNRKLVFGGLSESWAILELEESLGNQVGWLGLSWYDDVIEDQNLRGNVSILQAGYSAGKPHALSLETNCNQVTSGCRGGARHAGLVPLAHDRIMFLGFPSRQKLNADSNNTRKQNFENGLREVNLGVDEAGRASRAGGKLPRQSLAMLLRFLGYIQANNLTPSDAELKSAIEHFEETEGRSVRGELSLETLSRLLDALLRAQSRVS